MASPLVFSVVILAVITGTAKSADPDMLQDICVADLKSDILINGFVCKNMSEVHAMDFSFAGLAVPGNTNNPQGSRVTLATVQQIPGLNTLGVSMARIDYASGGLNPPHTHPRGTEMIFVLYGQLEVGFITTANVFISTTIKQGENFVFPRGLVHFQKNNGKAPAAALAAFNSQLPGTQVIATTLFASSPPVSDDVLSKAFQVSVEEVEKIKAGLAPKK